MKISKPARAISDILMMAVFFLVPHFGFMPIYIYPIVMLLLCWLYLVLFGEKFSNIGFRFSDITTRSFITGCLLAIVYFLIYTYLLDPLLSKILHIPAADIHDFDFVKGNIFSYIFILAIAWLLAVPYEEIIFRGFIFTRLQKILPATKMNFIVAGFVTSAIFGFYHLQQGVAGIIHAFLFGIVVTVLYKFCKGNLWYLIFFHAMYDTLAISAIRFGL